MKEIILNGLSREQMLEGVNAAKVMQEGFELLVDQVDRITAGEEVPQSEIRVAKLKLTEAGMIMNDLNQEQKNNESLYSNPNKPLNREGRRKKNRAQR